MRLGGCDCGDGQDGDGGLSRAEVAAISGAAASMALLYASKRVGSLGDMLPEALVAPVQALLTSDGSVASA